MTVTPFRICVSDEVLNDLRIRLTRTRFTAASDPAFWAAGTDPGYLRELVTYWADGFDWRAAERDARMAEQLCGNAAGRTAARRPGQRWRRPRGGLRRCHSLIARIPVLR